MKFSKMHWLSRWTYIHISTCTLSETKTNSSLRKRRKFLKHTDEHWLALLSAVCRVHSQIPALKHYYFKFISNNDKSASRNSRFKALQETIKNEEKRLSIFYACLETF